MQSTGTLFSYTWFKLNLKFKANLKFLSIEPLLLK
jgi:hypothetical protein